MNCMNCWTFIQDKYPELRTLPDIHDVQNIKNRIQEVNNKITEYENIKKKIKEIKHPEEKCLVLMNDYHIGYFENNVVHHFDKQEIHEPLYKLKYKYKKIRYFRIENG